MARKFDARPDKADFRDQLYEPRLINVPARLPLQKHLRRKVPVLDQGYEGACTGFGLAAVAHCLMKLRSKRSRLVQVSPRMMYEMAKKYDEWPGEDYDGSSARGAVKGWHKHGVCAESRWPYVANKPGDLNAVRVADAAKRPLGAYYRVNPKDLMHLHTALAEVGILYATADVHEGWEQVKTNGMIPSSKNIIGGHAFALVGYDERGIWLQNSWGPRWGKQGYARLSYADWLRDGYDVWALRLGVPTIV